MRRGSRLAALLAAGVAWPAAVHAQVLGLDEFSCHADADEIIGWLAAAPAAPETVYVVHGEPAASAALVRRIRTELGWSAVAPRHGERAWG